MTETIKETITNKKNKKERSTAYPGVGLAQAVEYSAKFISAFGKSPFNRDSAVQALGLKSVTGPSAMKVSALVHFGLLERKGNSYENSELAERIVYFASEEEKLRAIVEAALRPKLFNSLVQKYTGSSVPSLLSNILVTTYKINRNVANNVAKNFKESMDYAGLCVNGIIIAEKIQLDGAIDVATSEIDKKIISKNNPIYQAINPAISLQKNTIEMTSFTLPSGIIISYPSDMSYLFSIGKFGSQIEALDKAIKEELNNEKSD